MRRRDWVRWGLIGMLLLAVLAGQSWATYRVFTSRFPGGNDFYARWANGCALIWSGENPYADEVTLRTQIGMHGRPAEIGEDLAAFSYPLYTLFLFWPLCFVEPYPLVQAIWMTLMVYAVLGGLILTAKVADWRPSAWIWGLTLFWGVFNYPHARAVILGQMATVVFVAFVGALWAVAGDRDGLAGSLLAVTTIKPQMSFLLIPWILWWSAWQRRWGIWQGLLVATAVFVGGSLFLVPSWIGDFVEAVRQYNVVAGEPGRRSVTWIITRDLLGLGRAPEGVVVALLALALLGMAWRHRRAGREGFLWTTGLILIVTNFVAPRTATTHYTMLLLPLFVWFAGLRHRLGPWTGAAVVVIQVGLLVGQWAIFLITFEGQYESALVYLPFPVLMLAVQALSKKQWPEAGEKIAS